MNGARPDAVAKISRNAKTSSTVIIGMSHHILRAHRKPMNSPTTPRLLPIFLKNWIMSSLRLKKSGCLALECILENHETIHHQQLQRPLVEGVEGVLWRGNNRF